MSLTVVAQQYANLEVSNPQFVYDVNSNFNLRTANSTTSKLAPVTMGVYQEVSALFRNTGSKSIKSTLWEFIFYEDAMRTKVERVYTSRSKTIISPGEMIRLKKVGRLSDHTQYQEAKVVRIEYEDGTIWEGVKTKY
jgi:hypothetical protein